MHKTMPDISFPVFLINGIIPYFIFSNITNRCINAIEANQGLFNYRPVKPIDTVISRAILETAIYVLVYVVLMLVLWLIGEDFKVHDLLLLVYVWALLVILSCGLGMVFMTIGRFSPETEKFLPILIKPLYFLSCIMFPLHSIPKQYWGYILWNPIVHVVEFSREAVVMDYYSDGISLGYLSMSTLIIFYIGLICYRNTERKMLTS